MKIFISCWLTPTEYINHLTIYRANILHKNEAMHGLFEESNIFNKYSIYGLYTAPIALYRVNTDY